MFRLWTFVIAACCTLRRQKAKALWEGHLIVIQKEVCTCEISQAHENSANSQCSSGYVWYTHNWSCDFVHLEYPDSLGQKRSLDDNARSYMRSQLSADLVGYNTSSGWYQNSQNTSLSCLKYVLKESCIVMMLCSTTYRSMRCQNLSYNEYHQQPAPS